MALKIHPMVCQLQLSEFASALKKDIMYYAIIALVFKR